QVWRGGADMNRRDDEKAAARFAAYVQDLSSVLGHADRSGPLRDYCTGLILPCERKSVEPMAARTAPSRTAAQHQSLLQFVGGAVDRKALRPPAASLSALPAAGLGQGSRTPEEGGRACAGQVQDQAGDRARSDQVGV